MGIRRTLRFFVLTCSSLRDLCRYFVGGGSSFLDILFNQRSNNYGT